MLKVAIVGCGKIADQHAEVLQYIPDCTIVAVCDSEELMAEQFAERFGIKKRFLELEELICSTHPDVVHITTPPQSHFELGMKSLTCGCNVYIEKPFTINTEEAEILIKCATEKNLKLTVGHNDQFSHASRRMRKLVANGLLGGPPVHIESYYCYDLQDPGYAKSLLGDKKHWVRNLPGKLLQNVISHGISRIAEYLTGETPHVLAHGFSSQTLKTIDENDICDELRAIIHDPKGLTAYFTFSSQMRPTLHQFRMYGPQNGLILDNDQQTIIKLRGDRFKSYLEQLAPPLLMTKEYLAAAAINFKDLITTKLHMNSGMKYLIEAFYASIKKNKPLPIPYREIILTTRIMDAIFMQLSRFN